ncbi:class I SAM-dependent methyltransferase [Jannaschia sp. KMU-145]|uniref:class I SAM-dependent methyltransferase n=1 Tax=Jannaschia halovivens TaxID=3388667 RepID=UPI00396AF261
MTDRKTIAVYDAKAEDYAEAFDGPVPRDLEDFADHLPPGGRVLDLGCGPGAMSGWLADMGFAVEAWDASAEMVGRAGRWRGVEARQASFSDLTAEDAFDGIWASFSLLHARRADLPDLIARIARACRPGGTVYVAMKIGTGEGRDALGRFYTYVTEPELTGWLTDAGLRLGPVRTGRATGLAGTHDPYITVIAHA